jgi:hypothetical protein
MAILAMYIKGRMPVPGVSTFQEKLFLAVHGYGSIHAQDDRATMRVLKRPLL